MVLVQKPHQHFYLSAKKWIVIDICVDFWEAGIIEMKGGRRYDPKCFSQEHPP